MAGKITCVAMLLITVAQLFGQVSNLQEPGQQLIHSGKSDHNENNSEEQRPCILSGTSNYKLSTMQSDLFTDRLVDSNYSEFLTIDDCYSMAENNYPLVSQLGLIDKSGNYSVASISKGSLPVINIGGQASLQSDVTKIPFSIPGYEINEISRDQYKIYAEVLQPLTNLYTVRKKIDLEKVNTNIEKSKIEVELYKLKERINQLFFGILLIDEQLHNAELLKKDVIAGIEMTKIAIASGTAYKSNADLLQAELLGADQRIVALKAVRNGYAEMLSLFINMPVDETTRLIRPDEISGRPEIERPELSLFNNQRNLFDINKELIRAKTLPDFNLFLQGGYGRPALNMLNNDFDFYYIIGVRLNWNLSGYYTSRKDKQIIELNRNVLGVQEETFIFNTRLQLKQHESEIIRLKEMIRKDHEIIALRNSIKITSQSQLENGTITTNDFLLNVNAEDRARQDLVLHEVQLLMAQYIFKTTAGN